MLILKVIVLGFVSLLAVTCMEAYAADNTFNNSIGIAFSKVYLSQLKLSPDLHPNYEDLLALNLDNCNPKISGDFKTIDGIYQRDTSNLLVNNAKFYQIKDYLICIDPPRELRNRVHMIYLESQLDIYKTQDQLIKFNNTRTLSEQRYINEKCTEAVIGAENYLKLLADTIHVMRNNCDYSKSTFNHIITIIDNSTNTDISTSQKWKEDKWKKEIKQTHIALKINNDNSTNKSVYEDKDPKYVPPKTPPFDYSKYK
jgi:hypothetical protein